jgi:hypothetical protein
MSTVATYTVIFNAEIGVDVEAGDWEEACREAEEAMAIDWDRAGSLLLNGTRIRGSRLFIRLGPPVLVLNEDTWEEIALPQSDR